MADATELAKRLRRMADEIENLRDVKQIEQVSVHVDVNSGIMYDGVMMISEPSLSVEANTFAKRLEFNIT